jgi:hypothetical protein
MLGVNRLMAVLLLCASTAASAADEKPICPDRPSKSTGPCTDPEGKWQIETGLIDWTHDKAGGERTDEFVWGGTTIKYGISGNADVELSLAPMETMATRANGAHERHSSFGDIDARVKYRLTGESAAVQVALEPFVKLPTANRQLGNGKLEGGVLMPIQVSVGKGPFTLSFDPEFDLLADAVGHGRHLAMSQVVNLAVSLSEKLSISSELWHEWDWDPARTVRQASADGSIAYLLSNDLQLDGGANFGLNRNTPDVELYTGVSVLF